MSAKTFWSAAALLAASVATGACTFEHSSELISPTMPSLDANPGTGGLTGLWTSGLPSGPPSSWVCGNFQWNVTEQTPTTLAGSFSGLCGGVLLVQGSGNAQLNGSVVTLNVNGQVSATGVITTCPFTLNATGQLEGQDSIHVNYTGSTCFGPVQGSETLRRPGAIPAPVQDPSPPANQDSPPPPSSDGNPYHVGIGPLTGDQAWRILEATAAEFPHLSGAHHSEHEALSASAELLVRYIWHLQRAGFNAGRQRNPSGAISNDKLTIFLDGQWKAFDVFFDLGGAGHPVELIWWEVFPANHVPDGGIPD